MRDRHARRGLRSLLLLLLVALTGGALSCADARTPSQAAAQPPAHAPDRAPAQAPAPAPAPEEGASGENEENSENSTGDEAQAENAAQAEAPSEAPCPPTALRVAHQGLEGVPAALGEAVARVSADLRAVEVLIGSARPQPNARGHFARPARGQARFEFEAVRTYRRSPIPLGPLGSPESRQGGLRHPRVVLHDGAFTFSERHGREVGQVVLTHLDAERVCGRVALDDGFGRVQGTFTARVIGPLPD